VSSATEMGKEFRRLEAVAGGPTASTFQEWPRSSPRLQGQLPPASEPAENTDEGTTARVPWDVTPPWEENVGVVSILWQLDKSAFIHRE
jgi:hypothetical protein